MSVRLPRSNQKILGLFKLYLQIERRKPSFLRVKKLHHVKAMLRIITLRMSKLSIRCTTPLLALFCPAKWPMKESTVLSGCKSRYITMITSSNPRGCYFACVHFLFVHLCSHIGPDQFYIEPRNQSSRGKILQIDRVTQEFSLAGTVAARFQKFAFHLLQFSLLFNLLHLRCIVYKFQCIAKVNHLDFLEISIRRFYPRHTLSLSKYIRNRCNCDLFITQCGRGSEDWIQILFNLPSVQWIIQINVDVGNFIVSDTCVTNQRNCN